MWHGVDNDELNLGTLYDELEGNEVEDGPNDFSLKWQIEVWQQQHYRLIVIGAIFVGFTEKLNAHSQVTGLSFIFWRNQVAVTLYFKWQVLCPRTEHSWSSLVKKAVYVCLQHQHQFKVTT